MLKGFFLPVARHRLWNQHDTVSPTIKLNCCPREKTAQESRSLVLFPALQLVRKSSGISWIFPTARSWKKAQFTCEHENTLSLNIILDLLSYKRRAYTMQVDTLRHNQKNQSKQHLLLIQRLLWKEQPDYFCEWLRTGLQKKWSNYL